MLANLACSVLEHGRIKTTEARAKEVKPMVEKMITMGKAGDLNSRRTAISQLRNKQISYKLFNEIAPKYADRPGGYTRIIHVGPSPGRRGGDGVSGTGLGPQRSATGGHPARERAQSDMAIADAGAEEAPAFALSG